MWKGTPAAIAALIPACRPAVLSVVSVGSTPLSHSASSHGRPEHITVSPLAGKLLLSAQAGPATSSSATAVSQRIMSRQLDQQGHHQQRLVVLVARVLVRLAVDPRPIDEAAERAHAAARVVGSQRGFQRPHDQVEIGVADRMAAVAAAVT